MKTILQEYKTWLNTLGFCQETVYEYPLRVRDFLNWLEERGIKKIYQVKQVHINQYFNYLETRKNQKRDGTLSHTHLNRNFIAVDKLLEFLHQKGTQNIPSPTNYRLKIDEEERAEKINVLSTEDIKILCKNIPNTYPKYLTYAQREAKHYQLKIIFALYYGCGLRRTEGERLKVEDIDLNRREIFIKQGKNYKDRIVPMSEGVYRDLEDYIYNFRSHFKDHHYYSRNVGNRLFIHTSGCLLRSLRRLQETAKISIEKPITFHCLRHSIATHLLQNEMEIENISLFLGHSSLETTQIYTHLI